MNTILRHQWGDSVAADAVLRLVCGRGRVAMREILMFWNAYADESEDDDIFVLGGYASTAKEWSKFSIEWEKMLRFLPNYMGGIFKMSSLMSSDYYSERALAFYRIVEKHDLIAMACTFRKQDQIKAFDDTEWEKSRILDFSRFEKRMKNPYIFAFGHIIHHFVESQNMYYIDQGVDFIFDDKSEKTIIRPAWDYVRENVGDRIRNKLGIDPVFEKEDRVMPLQAADMFAWLVRIWEHKDKDWAISANPEFPWLYKTMLGRGFKVDLSYDDFIERYRIINKDIMEWVCQV